MVDARSGSTASPPPRPPSPAAEPTAASVAGMEVEVIRSAKRRKSVSARVVDGRIVVRMPQWMTKAQEAEYVEALVAKLVRQHTADDRRPHRPRRRAGPPLPAADAARRSASSATRPAAGDRARRPPARSASATASPAFPGWVLDAVIVHELAHLVEANHSPAFHALADRYPKQERAHGFLLAMQLTDDDVDDYGA